MLNVSDKFKEALSDDKRDFEITAEITLSDGTELTITNAELWSQGFEVESAVSSDGSFDIGDLIIGKMRLVLNNIYEDYTQYDFYDASVNVTLSLNYDDGTNESLRFDNYTVDEANDNASQIVLSCLDNAKRFERPYSESTLVYPTDVNTIIRDACDTCGVPLLTTSVSGGGYIVPARPVSDDLTFLKVVSWCAQITGNFARINNLGQLVIGWYDVATYESTRITGGGENGTDWSITDSTADSYHHVTSWGSLSTGTDDVTITGVRVTATGADNAQFDALCGTEGYVLEITNNELIGVSDVQRIANQIGAKVVGMNFRTYRGACLGSPIIEPGDLIWFTDRKGRNYRSFICGTSFKVGQYQNLYCGAATPSKQSATGFNETTRAIVKTRQALQKSLTTYEDRVASMAQLIARGFGMYYTAIPQQDGSVIPYIHDKPTIEESSYVAYMTSQGIMMESDGTTTAAVDKNGNALLNTLTTRGINADWINSGAISIRDTNGNETFYANCLTGEVRINASSFSLTGSTIQQITQNAVNSFEVGARNLLLVSEGAFSATKSSNTNPVTAYVNLSAYGKEFIEDPEQVFTLSATYEVTDNVSETAYIYAQFNGYTIDDGKLVNYGDSRKEFVFDAPKGVYKRSFTLTDAQIQSTSSRVRFVFANATTGAVLTIKRMKLELGAKATDWTPAPEDMQTGIDNAVTTANNANATAQQALDVASSAGGLVAYLNNDYQSIPTDADGNYTTFPECSSQITVFFNSADVSAQCTYTTSATTGVAGTWDLATRTYAVTGLSTDSGTVTISAAYNNTSLSKKFTVAKLKQGISGTNGHNGDDGRGVASVDEYYAISESDSTAPQTWGTSFVKPTEELPYLWNFNRILYTDNTTEDSTPAIIGNYSKDGTNGANGEAGRGISSIAEHYGLSSDATVEPSDWSDAMLVTTTTDKYLWNYETITYTDGTAQDTSKRIIGTHGATGEVAFNYALIVSSVAIVRGSDGTLTPQSIFLSAKRTRGTYTPTNYSGRFKVEVSVDGETFTTEYTSNANESTHSYTPPSNAKLIRASLYLAGGTYTLLDTQTIAVVSDGENGKSISTITNYYLASASSSGVTTSTSGWATNPTDSNATITSAKPYLWNYEVCKDETGTILSTTSPCIIGRYGKDGTNGTNGTDGKGITSITEYYALSTTTTAPADSAFTTAVKTPTATNKYLWNYEKITYTDNTTVSTSKHIIGVHGDSGADSYAVILSNESHTFAGDVSNALASSIDCSVIAFKGATRVPATIGAIAGQVTGLSASISSNGTTSAKFTVSSTTSLTQKSGILTVPITVDGKTITKNFSWSVSFKGSQGAVGASARTYFLDVSPKSVKLGNSLAFTPSTVTINSYYRDGNSTTQTQYSGYIIVQACVNNSWTQIKTYAGSSLTLSLSYTSNASASINGSIVYLPQTASALRVQLKSTSSSTTFLDQQEIIILVDISSLTQEIIFNKLTNNGETQGLYLEGGKIYLNAEYIKTGTLSADYIKGGTLKLGGSNNTNGLLQVLDANGTVKVTLNNEGITALAGKLGNWEIINNTIRREQKDGVGNVLLQAPSSDGSTVISVGAKYNTSLGRTEWNKAPFYVTGAGEMHSVSGVIGGWEIRTSSIRYAVKGTSENTLLGAGTNYPISVGATWETNAANPNWGGAVFRVAKDGTLTARNANIIGELTDINSDGDEVNIRDGHIYGKVASNGRVTGQIKLNELYGSGSNNDRNVLVWGDYGVILKAGNTAVVQIGENNPQVTVTNKGLTADSLHASNGYTGWVYLPVQMVSDGTVSQSIRLYVEDGIIKN